MAYCGKINTKITDNSLLPEVGKMLVVSLTGLLLTFQDSASDLSEKAKMPKEKTLTLENVTDVLSKMSVLNHQVTLYNIAQHGRPELCYSESLKSCRTHAIYHYSFCIIKIIYI
jgi:hypothetical protein